MEWRNKLQEFEETPPSQCWSAIQESLAQDVPALKDKLYDISEPVPAAMKQRIFTALNKEERQNVFSLTRSRAVAAASIGVLLALSVLYIISPTENKPQVGTSVINSISKNKTAHSFIIYTDQHGEQIKISTKLKSLLNKNNKDTTMQHWQHKMATSPYVPAGNNFFDIAEMAKILEENKAP